MGASLKTRWPWWFKVLSKGNKKRLIAYPTNMLNALISISPASVIFQCCPPLRKHTSYQKTRDKALWTSSRQIRNNCPTLGLIMPINACCEDVYELPEQTIYACDGSLVTSTGIVEDVKKTAPPKNMFEKMRGIPVWQQR